MRAEVTTPIDFFPEDDGRISKRDIVVRQAIILCVVVIVYLVNKVVLRNGSTVGALRLAACYLSDLMAPIAVFSASNIVFAFAGFQLRKLLPMMGFCVVAASVWEFVAPLFIPESVSDPLDVIVYFAGGILYWLINRQMC